MERGLWKDIERFLDGTSTHEQVPVRLEPGRSVPRPAPAPQVREQPESPSGQPNMQAIDTPRALQPPASGAPVSAHEFASVDDSVKEEVQALKLRYIVGRFAGRDLLDGSGQRIVSQGEVITEEAVSRAEQAGKLVELIIYMSSTGVQGGP